MSALNRRTGKLAIVTLATVLVASGVAAADSTSTSTPTTSGQGTLPPAVCQSVSGPSGPGLVTTPLEVCSPWKPVDTWAASNTIELNTFSPDAHHPQIKAYAAWINVGSTDLALYPGYKGPGPSTLSRGPMMVPSSGRPRLLATFNSGFYESDEATGFFTHHTLYFPMKRGLATLVRYADGHVDVASWTGGSRPDSSVVMARQNLTLLVSGGVPTARAANNALWGLTLHGAPAVWRTAVGVDANGNLIYAAAPAQTAATLANIMVQLHCVRAMELDINPEWPIFVTYAKAGALGPTLRVPNPNQIPGRFLYPSTKDFFAVFSSLALGEPQPW